MSSTSSKNALRQHLLQQRKNLSLEHKNQLNQLVSKLVLDYFEAKKEAVIGAYLAFGGELNITSVMQQLQVRGHRIAVPRIDTQQDGVMALFEWRANQPMQANRFGIDEPVIRADQAPLTQNDFDALLIPLVGFDVAGHRLGMGGGYYDRWLAAADKNKPERIGIAYAWQQQAAIPFDTMDQPLHRIITDQGIIDCHSL